MFEVVGDAAVNQLPRLGSLGSGAEKEAIARQVEQTRGARPVEAAAEGGRSALADRGDEGEKTRNRLEDGKIIVEKYDDSGKLVKRTPPGYLPFGEIA